MPRSPRYPDDHPTSPGMMVGCDCGFCYEGIHYRGLDEHECMCCNRMAGGREIGEYFDWDWGDLVHEIATTPMAHCYECQKNCPDDDCLLQNYCCFSEDCECHHPNE